MPLAGSQLVKEPLLCEGGLLMVEITEEVFTPGSRRWKDVVDHDEHRQVMQLFLFTLGVCIDTRAKVILETVVTEEFTKIHNKCLSTLVPVLGYRLWIPLRWVCAPLGLCLLLLAPRGTAVMTAWRHAGHRSGNVW